MKTITKMKHTFLKLENTHLSTHVRFHKNTGCSNSAVLLSVASNDLHLNADKKVPILIYCSTYKVFIFSTA